jgi:hypothetical protein
MNNFPKMTARAIALFLSLGMISSLAGCETGGTSEGDDNGAETEQPAPASDEDGEDGDGDEDGEDD